MPTILWVVLGHLLYDFHWQNDFIAQMKGKSRFILGIHALTWAVFLSAIMSVFGMFSMVALLVLFITHFLIDGWKTRLPKTDEYFWAIFVDQGLHLLTIVLVVFLA